MAPKIGYGPCFESPDGPKRFEGLKRLLGTPNFWKVPYVTLDIYHLETQLFGSDIIVGNF